MANYAVTYKTTNLGTHAEVQAELEGIVESLSTAITLHLIGINSIARDRDRCIGFVLCDEVLWVDSAIHDHTVDGGFTLTEV